MHQLVGRLTALDPEASEGLKVIAYFDALVDGHATADVLLRGASVLSGCAAGFAAAGSLRRVDESGIHSPLETAPSDGSWPRHALGDVGFVWLERVGTPHANDDMILERLAISLTITLERSAPIVARRKAVDTVLDSSATRVERLAAAVVLRLDRSERYAVHAVPASAQVPDAQQTVFVTRAGAVRAVIRSARAELRDDAASRASRASGVDGFGRVDVTPRVGIGHAVAVDELDRSWHSALLALRMTSAREPLLAADDLGALLMVAQAADEQADEHPDVVALRYAIASSAPTRELVEALVATGSARATARELGLHHSTVQTRIADLSRELGFDVRSRGGHSRLGLTLRLYEVATNAFV